MLDFNQTPRAAPQPAPQPGADAATVPLPTDNTAREAGQLRERFFPGFFEILVPAVTSAIPQIVQVFRNENQLRDPANRQSPEAIERFLPQLLSVVGPVLSHVVPILVDQIQNAVQQRSIPRDTNVDARVPEELLPSLLGGVVPPIVSNLPTILQQIAGMFGGLVGGGRDATIPLPRLVDAEVSSRFLGPVLQAVLPAITSNLPILFNLINGVSRSDSRDVGVSWEDFAQTNRLWDNDVISVQLTPIDDPNSIEIALELAAHKTWWKGIQVQDDNGSVVREISVQDNRKSDSTRVDARILLDASGYLLFMKGKAFNIHTGMYRLATGGLNQLRGQRATFFWSAD
jgi:hypothetical protein